MTTLGWIAIACYAASVPVGFRYWFREFVNDFGVDEWGAVLGGIGVGLFFGALTAPAIATWRIFRSVAGDRSPKRLGLILAGETREEKAERLERERIEREEYIARLERELGIGEPA